MPKRNYVPTDADRVTGQNVRALRKRRGETLKETVEASGFGKDASTLAATERGERALTELEATKLAAHFGTTSAQVVGGPFHQFWNEMKAERAEAVTEQQWLGNDKPALFAVPAPAPDHIADETAYVRSRTLEINLDAPLSLADYREQVWIPYLENRYASDLKQTG